MRRDGRRENKAKERKKCVKRKGDSEMKSERGWWKEGVRETEGRNTWKRKGGGGNHRDQNKNRAPKGEGQVIGRMAISK